MNRWLITGLVVLGLLVLIGVGYDAGLFSEYEGSTWAMVLAALAAPYMAVKNFLFGNKDLKAFELKYKNLEQEEIKHRADLDARIQAKEQRVAELDKEIQLLDSKLEVLELKKTKVKKEVEDMTVQETKQELSDLFGD